MKKLKSLLLSAMCIVLGVATINAENYEMTSKKFKVRSFTSIKSNSVVDVVFTQSDKTSVVAEGAKEVIDNLHVSVNKGVLTIENDANYDRNNQARVMLLISSPTLHAIETEHMGNWLLKDNVKTDNLKIKFSGLGSFEALELDSKKVCILYDGVGNITLGGKADIVEVNSGGVGNVDCEALHAKTAIIRSTKTGKVKCFASDNVGVFNDGVGEVVFVGNPTVKNLQNKGLGKITEGS